MQIKKTTWKEEYRLLLPIKSKAHTGRLDDGVLTVLVERGFNTNVSFSVTHATHDTQSVVDALNAIDWQEVFSLPTPQNTDWTI